MDRRRVERKGDGPVVPFLADGLREVDRLGVEPWGGAGFQAPNGEPESTQRIRQAHRREIPRPSGLVAHEPHVDQSFHEGPGTEDHGLSAVPDIEVRVHPRRRIPVQHDRVDDRLLHVQPVRGLQRLLHPETVELLVRLGARGADRRPLARVQLAELDPGSVDVPPHLSAQRVDLPHEVPLRQPADRRVARHEADGVRVDRQEEGGASHSRRGERRLAAGVPASDDDDVVRFRVFVRRSAHPAPLNVPRGTFCILHLLSTTYLYRTRRRSRRGPLPGRPPPAARRGPRPPPGHPPPGTRAGVPPPPPPSHGTRPTAPPRPPAVAARGSAAPAPGSHPPRAPPPGRSPPRDPRSPPPFSRRGARLPSFPPRRILSPPPPPADPTCSTGPDAAAPRPPRTPNGPPPMPPGSRPERRGRDPPPRRSPGCAAPLPAPPGPRSPEAPPCRSRSPGHRRWGCRLGANPAWSPGSPSRSRAPPPPGG